MESIFTPEAIQAHCLRHDIHYCCLICISKCRQGYTSWSGCMPCTEYCEQFEIDPLWEKIYKELNK